MRIPGVALGRSLAGALRSPRGIFASLAGNSLVWRGIPDLLEAGLFRVVGIATDVLPFATILASAVTVNVATVGAGFEWLLFGYLVYRLVPRVLPDGEPATAVFGADSFRLLVVVLVTALAQPVAAVMPVLFVPAIRVVTLDSVGAVARLFVVWVVVAWTATSGYLYVRWWRTASVDDRLGLADQVTGETLTTERQESERRRLAREDWVGWASNTLLLVAAAGPVVVVCMLFGFAVGVGSVTFPLVEAVVLAGATASGLADRTTSERVSGPLSRVGDRAGSVETRFYTVLGHVTTSLKGNHVVTLVFTGFLLSAVMVLVSLLGLVAFGVVLGRVLSRPAVAVGALVGLWNAFGFFLCLVTPGLYSLWFWTRMTVRIPRFLAHWDRTTSGVEPPDGEKDLPDSVTRPPYYLLAPTALWIPVAAVMRFTDDAVVDAGSVAFAVGWPLVFGGVLWTVRWTLRNEPQSPSTDGRAMVAAVLVQLSWLVVLEWLFPDAFPFSVWTVAVVIAVAVIAFYYTPELELALRGVGGVPVEYTRNLYLVVLGVVLLALASVLRAVGTGTSPVLTRYLFAGGALLVALYPVDVALKWLANVS